MDIVVAGIGTGVGKTIVSAILTEALQADYWKPIQAGNLGFSDTDFLRRHVSTSKTIFHKEIYRFTKAASPHAAAAVDLQEIRLDKFVIPKTDNTLIIELAGGLMVPLNDRELNIDLLARWNLPVMLVSHNYLGSINHTLMSVEVLKCKGITVAGIIFNGHTTPSTEEFILKYTGLKCLGRVPWERMIDKRVIKRNADRMKDDIVKALRSNFQ